MQWTNQDLLDGLVVCHRRIDQRKPYIQIDCRALFFGRREHRSWFGVRINANIVVHSAAILFHVTIGIVFIGFDDIQVSVRYAVVVVQSGNNFDTIFGLVDPKLRIIDQQMQTV